MAFYLAGQTNQSKVTFGSYDKKIVAESKKQYGDDIYWVNLKGKKYWEVGLQNVQVVRVLKDNEATSVVFDSGYSTIEVP